MVSSFVFQVSGSEVQDLGLRVQSLGFRIRGCYITNFAPYKALKAIARGTLTFDQVVILHRVVPRKALRTLNQKSFLEDFINFWR